MLAVLLAVFVVAGVGGVPPTENALLVQVLDAVQKTLDFFAEDYSAINVDGLFGLRLGQGQMREAVRECRVRTCDAPLLRRLTDMEALLNNASDSALPYLESGDPAYFTRFHATIDQPYVLPYQEELVEAAGDTGVELEHKEKGDTGLELNHKDKGDTGAKVGNNENYNEEAGDACYARMLGSYEENGKTLPRCNITTHCWAYMTQDDTAAYFITHQLLYFIMTEHVGCKEQVEAFTKGRKIREIQQKFCRKIYQESKQLSSNGKVANYRKDLFLEQTVLCGPLGFQNFYRSDWIRMVLGWPDKRLGCFRQYSVDGDIKAFLGDLAASKESGHTRRDIHPSSYDTTKDVTMRRLLREKQMKGGVKRAGGSVNARTEDQRNPTEIVQKHLPRVQTTVIQRESRELQEGPLPRAETKDVMMRRLLREKQMKDGCLSHTSGLGFGVLCSYLRFLVGCKEQVEAFTQWRKIREIQQKLCRNIYQESKQLLSKGKVANYRKDLFLEQTVFCGPLGFQNVYHSDWIRMVLIWPDKRLGCFRQFSVDGDLKALLGDLAATKESGHTRRNTHPSSYDT